MQTIEFSSLPLSSQMIQALDQMGYKNPTLIQSEVISHLMSQERADLVALAQTGSGKTAAFGVPLIEKIEAKNSAIQALVLAPTRELAAQIDEILAKMMRPFGLRSMTVYGGQSYTLQRDQLRKKPHVLIATPGRLVDLLNQKLIDLTELKVLVMDEADRMLSMGFEEDLQAILNYTHISEEDQDRASCQTWLFSATMAPGIKRILNRYLENPKIIEQVSENKGISSTLKHHYLAMKTGARAQALVRLLKSIDDFYGIIFCQTKREVADVEELLRRNGMACMSLHGDKQQKERESILKSLKNERFHVLIATDVAARGLDVKNLTHVIHYSLPIEIESYIHRSGRTGRNGEDGLVISLIEPTDFSKLNRLKRVTQIAFTPYEMPSKTEVLKKLVQAELNALSKVKVDSEVMQELKLVVDQLLTVQETQLFSTADWLAAVLSAKMKDASIWREDIYIQDFSIEKKGQQRRGFDSRSDGQRRFDRGSNFRGQSRGDRKPSLKGRGESAAAEGKGPRRSADKPKRNKDFSDRFFNSKKDRDRSRGRSAERSF